MYTTIRRLQKPFQIFSTKPKIRWNGLFSQDSVALLALHHLASDCLDDFIARDLKTVRPPFGKIIRTRNMHFDFSNLVRVLRIPLEPQKHLTGNQLVMKGPQLR